MRKRRNIAFAVLILAVLAALVLSLSACAEKQTKNALEPYSTGWDGRVYTVTPIDNDKGTISDGTNTYSYRYDASGSGYSVTFTYPDGETYRCMQNGSTSSGAVFSSGSTSPDFDFDKYPDGMTLKRVLEQSPSAKSEKKSTKNWGIILFLLFVGGINTACPQLTWYLDVGWKVKDGEPSEAALGWSRTVGVVLLIVAVVMMIVWYGIKNPAVQPELPDFLPLKNTSLIPTRTRKPPKSLRRSPVSSVDASSAPGIAVRQPARAAGRTARQMICLFLTWKKREQTAVGRKYKRFTPCAVRCSMDCAAVSQTMRSEPPPIPNPESTPQRSPAKTAIRKVNIKLTSRRQIKSGAPAQCAETEPRPS